MIKIVCRAVSAGVYRTLHLSLIRVNPEQATSEGETAGQAVLGEAGTRPADKKSP